MRVTVGVPIADVRAFVSPPTHRLTVPPWHLLSSTDFVRSFGGGVDTSEGGLRSLDVDHRYCEARHSIRFPDDLGDYDFAPEFPEDRTGFSCAPNGRRLMSTKTTEMFRVEVEFRRDRPFPPPPHESREAPLDPTDVVSLVDRFLDLDVIIGKRHRRPNERPYKAPDGRDLPRCTTLRHMGAHLASLFLLASTTAHGRDTLLCPPWWVAAGSTLIVIEYQNGELEDVPPSQRLELDDAAGLAVNYFRVGRPSSHVLLVGRSRPATDHGAIVQLQEVIRHVHTEADTVAHVLRQLNATALSLESGSAHTSALLSYLDRATHALLAQTWFGMPHGHLLAVLYTAFGWGAPSARSSLFDQLDQQKARLGSRLSSAHSSLVDKAGLCVVLENTYNIDRLEVNMNSGDISGDTYNVPGQANVVGPGATTHGTTMSQVWNTQAENIPLAKLAEELALLRDELKKRAVDSDHDIAIGEVAQAQQAASNKEGTGALEHLKRAGHWVLDVAKDIGVGVATTAIKAALGLP